MKKLLLILLALFILPCVMAASVTRTVQSTATANANVQVTLTATGTSGSYFAIVRDNIPDGWTYVSGGALEGNQVKAFLTDIAGGSITYTLRAGTSSGTITGTYQFADDASASQIGSSTVTVGGPTLCGNGVCDSGETNANCAADCPITTCTYSNWGTCSSSCTQTRTVLTGTNCPGPLSQSCTGDNCASSCTYSDWSTCSSSCTQTRTILTGTNCGSPLSQPCADGNCVTPPPFDINSCIPGLGTTCITWMMGIIIVIVAGYFLSKI